MIGMDVNVNELVENCRRHLNIEEASAPTAKAVLDEAAKQAGIHDPPEKLFPLAVAVFDACQFPSSAPVVSCDAQTQTEYAPVERDAQTQTEDAPVEREAAALSPLTRAATPRWTCNACTFAGNRPSERFCNVCGKPHSEEEEKEAALPAASETDSTDDFEGPLDPSAAPPPPPDEEEDSDIVASAAPHEPERKKTKTSPYKDMEMYKGKHVMCKCCAAKDAAAKENRSGTNKYKHSYRGELPEDPKYKNCKLFGEPRPLQD